MTQRDFERAGRRAYQLTGMSGDQIMAFMRDAARRIADELIKAEIPVESKRHRPDVGPIQIDMVVIQEKVSKPEPGMRLAFDIEGEMGVTLMIKLFELLEDPDEYVRNLFAQLGPMRRNMARRRRDTRAANEAIHKALTKGAQNG